MEKAKFTYPPLDKALDKQITIIKALLEKCPYSEFFWSVFSPNAGKCGPEKLQMPTLFTH